MKASNTGADMSHETETDMTWFLRGRVEYVPTVDPNDSSLLARWVRGESLRDEKETNDETV